MTLLEICSHAIKAEIDGYATITLRVGLPRRKSIGRRLPLFGGAVWGTVTGYRGPDMAVRVKTADIRRALRHASPQTEQMGLSQNDTIQSYSEEPAA